VERRPGWLEGLISNLSPEIRKLKSMAIGTALGLIRDTVTRSVPGELGVHMSEIIDNVTTKLGGEVIPGQVLGLAEQEGERRCEMQASMRHNGPVHAPASSSGPSW